MTILFALKQQKDFNPTEKQIAEAILENPEKILTQSIHDLAAETFSSTSSIIRLCRKIGLDGFKAFKRQLTAELAQYTEQHQYIDPDFPFLKEDAYTEITDKLKELSIRSLHQTADLFSDELFASCIDYLKRAKKVGIFAYGDTALPALNFQNKMMKIGYHLLSSRVPGEDHHLSNSLDEADCAILLSYSGESKNTYQIARLLKSRNVPIIVITAYPNSHIGQLANLILPVAKNESTDVKLSTFSSQISIDYTLNSLYSCIFVTDYERNKNKRIQAEKLFLDDRF